MDKKDFNIQGGAHRRYVANNPLTQTRAEGSGEGKSPARIRGIASVVDVEYDMYWWKEVIRKDAFNGVMNDDVRCLFNHDSNHLLARKNANTKTLDFYLTEKGDLAYEYTTPDRSFAWDLQNMVEDGDVDQSSFQFQIEDAHWETSGGEDLLVIDKIARLYDVSPVTFPASPSTTTELAQRTLDSGIIMPAKRTFNTELLQRKFQLLGK